MANSKIDLVESKEMHQLSVQMTKGKKFVVLIDARAPVHLSKESREYGSSQEVLKNTIAQAILVDSIANKLIGNFIIQFHKPIAKTKLFSAETIAINWLQNEKNKN